MTITFEVDWQDAEKLKYWIRGMGFESLTLALHEELQKESEAEHERRQGDAWEGGFAANH